MHEVVHGTIDGYSNHGCRCDLCRAAGKQYHENRKTPCPGGCGRFIHGRFRPGRMCIRCTADKRRKPFVHGTESGYTKGCRCASCTHAATAARRERRRRR